MQGHKHCSPGHRCNWYQEHANSKNNLRIEGEQKILLSDTVLIKTDIHHDFAFAQNLQRKRLLFFILLKKISISHVRQFPTVCVLC